jgi:hypothetical protein
LFIQALKLYVNGKHSERATAVISSFFGVPCVMCNALTTVILLSDSVVVARLGVIDAVFVITVSGWGQVHVS